jgi:hypothetical protein
LVIDKLEEQRYMFKNFRPIWKKQIERLLKYKNSYRRQRYTERWVTLGDEYTKFFHAAATNRYRHNVVADLVDEEGISFSDHEGKLFAFGGLSRIVWGL